MASRLWCYGITGVVSWHHGCGVRAHECGVVASLVCNMASFDRVMASLVWCYGISWSYYGITGVVLWHHVVVLWHHWCGVMASRGRIMASRGSIMVSLVRCCEESWGGREYKFDIFSLSFQYFQL